MRLPAFLLQAVALVLGVAVESAIMPHLAPPGVRGDLVLILTVLTGLHQGRLGGTAWGFIGGLLEDVVAGRVIGISALSKMTVGYLVGSVREIVFKDSLLVPVVLVALGGLVHAIITWLLAGSFGIIEVSAPGFIRATMLSTILNVVLAPLVSLCPIFSHGRGVSDVGEKA